MFYEKSQIIYKKVLNQIYCQRLLVLKVFQIVHFLDSREQLSKLDTSHGDKMSTEGRTELRKILKSHAELVEEMEPKLQAGFQQPFGPHRSNSWATVHRCNVRVGANVFVGVQMCKCLEMMNSLLCSD